MPKYFTSASLASLLACIPTLDAPAVAASLQPAVDQQLARDILKTWRPSNAA